MNWFRCNVCNEVFNEPYVRTYSEPMPDDIWEDYTEYHCPFCGSTDLEEGDFTNDTH